MKAFPVAVLLMATFCAPSSAQELSPADRTAADAAIKVIRPEAIAAHMRFLSDDLLEGRQTGARGHEIGARYVATELESLGLAPAGVNGTWFQPGRCAKWISSPSRVRSNSCATAKRTRWPSPKTTSWVGMRS